METIMLLNNTLEYIENNLDAELNIDNISKAAWNITISFKKA